LAGFETCCYTVELMLIFVGFPYSGLYLYSLLCSPSQCSPSSCPYSVSWVVLPLIDVHVIVVPYCHHMNCSQRLCQVIVALRADTRLLSAFFRPLRTLSSIKSSSNSSAILQEERIPLGGFG
jgi:hypothetical protein